MLAQVAAGSGLTAYDVLRIVARSPVGSVSASPGAIYPVVRRLRDRGMLEEGESGGRRNDAKPLAATAAGARALALWASTIGPEDVMPHDSLLSKVAAFAGLAKAERMRALFAARAAVDDRLDRVEGLLSSSAEDFGRAALKGARTMLRAKRSWLESLIVDLAAD